MGAGGPSASLTHAEALFAALQARTTDPYRDLKYDSARVRIASGAALPSRVFRDTSVWTWIASSNKRQLLVHGHFAEGRYRMEAATAVAVPDEPAEARHQIDLTRLSNDEYAWYTEVPFAIGSISAAEVGRFFTTVMSSAEGRTESQVRQDYRSVAPRTTAIAGQLFRVDSIRSIPLADRSTTALFAVTMTPQGVEQRYPEFAKYLRRYVHQAKVHMTLTDASGATYLDLRVQNSQLLMRVRTAGGAMLALYGPPRLMPDSMTLNADVTVKVRAFTVGVRNYRGEFRIVSNRHERAWEIVSRREPDWVLPLITEHLLRTPLRRPFQGQGATFRIGVRDSAGAQTILNRTVHLEVQESAVLRFLARLGAMAISDYAGDVEKEEMAFLRELFAALLEDSRALR